MNFSVFGLDFEADIERTPFVPAKTDGPADLCYEAEGGETEIRALTCNGHNAMYLLASDLEDEIISAIEAAL